MFTNCAIGNILFKSTKKPLTGRNLSSSSKKQLEMKREEIILGVNVLLEIEKWYETLHDDCNENEIDLKSNVTFVCW